MKPNTEFRIRLLLRGISFIAMIAVPIVLACVKHNPAWFPLMFVAMFIGECMLSDEALNELKYRCNRRGLWRLTYFGYYAWGDAMYLDRETLSVHGWKPYKFRDGEVAAIYANKADMSKEIVKVYVLEDVKWQSNPADMFFAKAREIGEIPYATAMYHGEEAQKLVQEMYKNNYKK